MKQTFTLGRSKTSHWFMASPTIIFENYLYKYFYWTSLAALLSWLFAASDVSWGSLKTLYLYLTLTVINVSSNDNLNCEYKCR